jgi:phage shock protein A
MSDSMYGFIKTRGIVMQGQVASGNISNDNDYRLIVNNDIFAFQRKQNGLYVTKFGIGGDETGVDVPTIPTNDEIVINDDCRIIGNLNIMKNTNSLLFVDLNNSGNIGIGNLNPLHKFSVNGNSYFNGNVISNNILSIESNVDSLESNVNLLQSNFDSLESNVSVLESNVSVLEIDVNALEANVDILQSNVSVLEIDVNALEANVDILQSNVSVLEIDLNALEANVDILQSNVSVLQSNVSVLEIDVNALESNVDILQSNVSVLQSNVSVLQSNVSVLEIDVNALESNVDILQSNVSVLESNVSVLEIDVNALEANVDILQSNVDILQSNVSVLQSNVSVLEIDVNALEANVDILQSNVSVLEIDVNALEANVDILQSNVSILESNVSVLQSNVSVLEIDVNALEANVDILQSNVSVLQSNVSVLEIDVNALEANVDILQSNVSVLESNVSVLEIDVNALEANVDILQSNVSVLESNVSVLEIDVNALEANVELLQNEISIGNLSTLQLLNGNTNVNGNLSIDTTLFVDIIDSKQNSVFISSDQETNSSSTGGLVVAGGIATQNKLHIGSSADSNSTGVNNALFVNGSSYFNQNVYINGNLHTFGDHFIANVSTLEVEDPLLFINSNGDINNQTGHLGFVGYIGNGNSHVSGFYRDQTNGFWHLADTTVMNNKLDNSPETTTFSDLAVHGIYFDKGNSDSGVWEYQDAFITGDNGNMEVFSESNIFIHNNNNSIELNNDILLRGGNVGIGTTSPNGKFKVQSDTGNTSLIDNSCDGTPGFQGISNTQGSVKSFYGSSILTNTACMGTVSNHPTLIGTNNTERIRILTNGNVGIGITSPAAKLDVNGTIKTGNTEIFSLGTNSTFRNINHSYGIIQRDNGETLLNSDNNNPLLFRLNNSNQMGLTSTGLGVKLISPDAKLHVLGGGFSDFSDFRIGTSTNYLGVGVATGGGGSGNTFFQSIGTGTRHILFNPNGGGNMGIGTSSPTAKLDVNGNCRFSGNISFPTLNTRIDAGNGSDLNAFVFDQSRGQIINSTSNLYFNMDTNNDDTSRVIQFASNRNANTGGTTIMTMTEHGNVGIGTTTPTGILHVESGSFTRNIRFTGGGGGVNGYLFTGPIYSAIGTESDHTFGLFANNSTQLWLTGTGNVGIGTSSPTAKLHVSGNSRFSGNTLVNGDIQLDWSNRRLITNFDTNNNYRQGINFDVSARNMRLFTTSGDSGANIIFNTQAGVGNGQVDAFYGTERMRITSDGNVGIGINTPSVQLDCSGSIRGVIIDTSDERIKENIVLSDLDEDMNLVKQINVYEYNYIDKKKYGNITIDGFIAQEINEIYPQAVHKTSDPIPNIMSEGFIKNHYLIFNQGNVSLEIGDALKINNEKVEISNINEIGNVLIDSNSKLEGNVFVYGSYVNDFLSIKKDKLFTMLFGAVKKLIHRVDELETEINLIKNNL